MSTPKPFRYESDPPLGVRALGVGLVTLGIMFGCILVAFFLLAFEVRRIVPGGELVPVEVRQAEVGIVIKTLYATDTRFEDERRRQMEELTDWSWVDRRKKQVRMPIDRAMNELIGNYGPARTSVHGTD